MKIQDLSIGDRVIVLPGSQCPRLEGIDLPVICLSSINEDRVWVDTSGLPDGSLLKGVYSSFPLGQIKKIG